VPYEVVRVMDERERIAKIEETIVPVIRSHGLDLVDLDLRGEGRRLVLRVFVDKAGGATIRDCERLSHEVGDVLEVSDLLAEPHDLIVSSPGLDRVLRTDREFQWARGKRVRCWLRDEIAGRTDVRGRLVEVGVDRLVVETDGGPVEVPRQSLAKARLEADVPWPRRTP
jgi:ribosome maturation factor RimP